MELQPVDRVNIKIIVDNYYDVFVPAHAFVRRMGPGVTSKPLIAGHGYSVLVEVIKEGVRSSLLVDTSHSGLAITNNLDAMGIDYDSIDALLITHGHFDHYGGLEAILKKRKEKLVVYIHPDAFLPKLLVTPKGKLGPWFFDRDKFENLGAIFEEHRLPVVVNDFFILSGEIERITEFEKPWKAARVLKGEREVQDYFMDEQAVGILVKGKGLVVIAGCSHPGIVNILKHMRNITGERIFAVIGGFHLGIVSDEVIEKTVSEIMDMGIEFVMPCHCTGFNAVIKFLEKMGGKVAISCVGSEISF